MYTSQGFINSILGHTASDTAIDFLGNPSLNIWAVLIAASWRHVGYVMVLYLAGLKSVDPTLREAASIDGANARQTFIRVVFPVMKPINIVVIVVIDRCAHSTSSSSTRARTVSNCCRH
jgi:ABC-type sugar transport system permease subunit